MSIGGPLAGKVVLVTRPVDQAEGLMTHLQELGARAFLFPALAIVGPSQPDALYAQLSAIAQYHWTLFVSPTAAQFGIAALDQAVSGAAAQIRSVAVGAGTAAALRAAGCRDVLAPETGADSEHVLALPELADLAGQRILIFRGEGGRELIADTLRARGAHVEYAECYRRASPHADTTPLRQALSQHRIDAVTVFSRETLDNLLQLSGTDAVNALRKLPLFVPHVRIAQHAQALDFARAIATAPGERGVLAGLVEYFSHV